MSEPLERIHETLSRELECLHEALKELVGFDLETRNNSLVQQYLKEVSDLFSRYHLRWLPIGLAYSKSDSGSPERAQKYEEFIQFITQINIKGILKKVRSFCESLWLTYDMSQEISPMVHAALQTQGVEGLLMKPSFRREASCECGEEMVVDARNNEFVCQSCGQTQPLAGEMFDDGQRPYQEGGRATHGKYEPGKHCRLWLGRIQGRGNTEIPEKDLARIRKKIKQETTVYIDNITYSDIRRYLKSLRLTKYNNIVPAIHNAITKKPVPQLTEEENKQVHLCFGRVIQVYAIVKPPDKPNCPYHPYFIYKIIEHLLDEPANYKRRRAILSCIHLQSQETLTENDRIWSDICEKLPELKYRPTQP